jgi:DNA-binding transcriptional regulator YdaS (Cro superfamily)
MTDNPIQRAAALMGGARQLARAAGVSHQAVGHWLTGARQISPASALLVAAATAGRVAAKELRPDIFAVTITPKLSRGKKK